MTAFDAGYDTDEGAGGGYTVWGTGLGSGPEPVHSHPFAGGTNMVLYVWCHTRNLTAGAGASPSAVKCGAVSMTKVYEQAGAGAVGQQSLWFLAMGTVGAGGQTIEADWGSQSRGSMVSMSFTGAKQAPTFVLGTNYQAATSAATPVAETTLSPTGGALLAEVVQMYVGGSPSNYPTDASFTYTCSTARFNATYGYVWNGGYKGTGTGGSWSQISGSVASAQLIGVLVESAAPSVVQASDLSYKYAQGSGGASNADPTKSLSGAPSSTVVTSGAANDIWADVTGAEEATGKDYYCLLYVFNDNDAVTWKTVKLWIDTAPPSGIVLEVGNDAAAAGSTATSSAADRFTAPSPVVTFSSPTTKAAGVTLGDIGPNQNKAFWLHMHANAGVAAGAKAVSIRCEGVAS